MEIKIVIIGLGSIGKRHLEAVSCLRNVEAILCCDLNRSALESVSSFLQENNIRNIRPVLTDDLKEALKTIDQKTVVIVSTTAKGRAKILEEVIGRRSLAVISEKPVCQSGEEYKRILGRAKQENVPVYVNFPRHLYDFYQEIYKSIKNPDRKAIDIVFPNGMACVGIHFLELATWLLDAKDYRILYAKASEPYETKRKGFFDFFGEIILEFDGKHSCGLRAEKENGMFSIEVSSQGKEYKILEAAQKMIIINGIKKIETRPVHVPYISQLTGKIIEDLVAKDFCRLPNVFQSYLSHKILFEYMNMTGLRGINIT